MAAITSITEVTHPNSQSTDFSAFAPFRSKMFDVTLSSSYATGGDTLAASVLGWDQIHGALVVYGPMTASGAAWKPCVVRPNAAKTGIVIQTYNENDAAAYAQRPAMNEAQNAANQSTYSVRLLAFGS